MREEQYEDEKSLNVITKDVTLDEWYEIWMNTCKKNCRNSTKESYATHYKRIQKELGWRKLTSLNLIIMQNVLKMADERFHLQRRRWRHYDDNVFKNKRFSLRESKQKNSTGTWFFTDDNGFVLSRNRGNPVNIGGLRKNGTV